MLSPRFIAFYSYKGGVGRSLAMANLAYTLAKAGRKVLVVDMDLEAPGQHHIDLYGLRADADPGPGILAMLLDYQRHQQKADNPDEPAPYDLDLGRYMRVIPDWRARPRGDDEAVDTLGSLWLMPAGNSSSKAYAEQLNEFSWTKFYAHHGQALLSLFKSQLMAQAFDDVLIDSRTGLSDEFFVTTLELADTVVCVTGYNRQNIAGTRVAVDALRSPEAEKLYGKKRLLVIGSPQPESLTLDEQSYRRSEIPREWPGFKDFNLELPYRPELALREVALARKADQSNITSNTYALVFPKLMAMLDQEDPFSSVIPARQTSPENPFAIIRKDYFSNEELLKYFVNPGGEVMQDMANFMPLVVTGARGSGKTMLAGRFSLEYWLAEQHNQGRSQIDAPPEQIGLYFRIDADFLHTFNHANDVLRDDFNRLFAQFFDIVVIRKALGALNDLGGVESWCDPQRLFQALYGEFDEQAPIGVGFEQFADLLETQLRRIRLFLNNPSPERRPTFLQANVLQKLLLEHLRRGPRFGRRYFVVLIDEYENYADYQQRIVNTRLKQSRREDGITYRLFMRSGGLRTRETLAPGQYIEATDDFRQHALDDWVSWADFRTHMLAVANRHMELQPYFVERGQQRFDSLLAELNPEDEAELLGRGRRRPLHDWVSRQYPQDKETILAWFDDEPNPLRRVTALVILNQGKSVTEVIDEFRADSARARDWYHNFGRGALFWLARLHHQEKRYAGLSTLISLAGFNIRTFLDFCHVIFAEWLKTEDLALPIPWEIQDRAIHRQANVYRDKLRSAERAPEQLNNLYERLGRLFEAAHKSPKQSEPEINHFAVSDRLDDAAKQRQLDHWLLDAWYTGTLRRMPGTKQKSLENLRLEDWQLTPQFAPLFNLSPRRKKKLILSAQEAYVLFNGTQAEWKQVYRKFARRFDVSEDVDEMGGDDASQQELPL